MKNIYLIGFMGTGKSTVAKELENTLHAKRMEMDQLIEMQQGMAITEIFEKYGETYFRDIETELLKTFVGEENLVVSCGGGSVLRDENAELMKRAGKIIWLRANAQTVYERVKDSNNRPILRGNMTVEYIRELMEKREERYKCVADIYISTDGKTIRDICTEIVDSISC